MTGRAEALGEAPEGVDGDVAVPAPRRPDAARRGAGARGLGRDRRARAGVAARRGRTTTRAAARAPPRVLAEHGWDRDLPSFRPFLAYAELATMFDTLSSLYDALTPVLGLGDIDELAARSPPPGWPTTTSARTVARRARRAASPGWTPTTSTPRSSPPRSAPASRTSTRSTQLLRGRARLQRRHRDAAPARRPRTARPTRRSATRSQALRVAERAHEDAARDRRRARDRTSPRCCAARSRCATRSG